MKTNSAVLRVGHAPSSTNARYGWGVTGGRLLRSGFAAVILGLLFASVAGASAADLPDLKATRVEIIPNNKLDARTSPVFKPDGILEVAATATGDASQRTNSAPLVMRMYRSYRFVVTIQNAGKVRPSEPFVVRTDCVREGKKPVTLGRTLVCMSGVVAYACFDVYPSELLVAEAEAAGIPLREFSSEAGKSAGMKGEAECVIRTIVDADNDVQESDESAASNTLDFKANLQR